jgi:hypothetical protein
MPISLFMAAGNGISYLAPHLDDCVIIALTEDGLVGSNSFCSKQRFRDSEYFGEITNKLGQLGIPDANAKAILKGSFNSRQ